MTQPGRKPLAQREIASMLDVAHAAGSHSLQLATGQLAGRMCLLRLINDDRRVPRPVVVR